jgi:7-cyano-7-deazaguanine synthase
MTGSLVVLSGGMDSATALAVAIEEGPVLGAISFNYGQRHSKELQFAYQQAEARGIRHDVIDLQSFGMNVRSALTSGGAQQDGSFSASLVEVPDGHYAEESMKATVVPNRNMVMFSIAAGIALSRGAESVWVGVHAGDHFVYPDCRPAFINAINLALETAMEDMQAPGHQVPQLITPFISLGKHDIAQIGYDLDVDYALTWSCYKGGENHCGRCGTCVERKEAFLLAEVHDPTVYDDPDFEIAAYKTI